MAKTVNGNTLLFIYFACCNASGKFPERNSTKIPVSIFHVLRLSDCLIVNTEYSMPFMYVYLCFAALHRSFHRDIL